MRLLKNALRWRRISGGRNTRWNFPIPPPIIPLSSNPLPPSAEPPAPSTASPTIEASFEEILLRELVAKCLLPFLEGEAEMGGGGGGKEIVQELLGLLDGFELVPDALRRKFVELF